MENVIEEISKIDQLAFEREEQNKMALAKERFKFESEIEAYRDERLKAAHAHADSVCEKLIKEAKSEALNRKEKSEKEIEQLKRRFTEVEQHVVEEVFAELFMTAERG